MEETNEPGPLPSATLPGRLRNGLRTAFRWSIVFGVLVAILAAAGPLLERPLFALRLSLRPAPQSLPVPVDGIAVRSLRDSWGGARGEGRKHEGIDIFAPRGRPVIANTDGLVWSTAGNSLGGTVVWVLGPGRQMHYYAHLDRIGPVAVGDRVEVGDVLGYVGTTGNARGTPPHLHYGIYTAVGAINPFPLLVAKPGETGQPKNPEHG